ARSGDVRAAETLAGTLSALPVSEALPVARAFSLFLTLVNIAEAHHGLRLPHDERDAAAARSIARTSETTFADILARGVSPAELHDAVSRLNIELVLTAHPTQVVRRTLLQKYNVVAELLAQRDGAPDPWVGSDSLDEALEREITSIWDTDEVMRSR